MAKKSTLVSNSPQEMSGKRVLVIISGGISAYKSLELIRLLKKSGIETPAILTDGGQQFITPLSVSALSGHPVYTDLFSLKDEQEMGHIRLSRDADLIVVVPATANLMARTANGFADDLASTVLLASNVDIQIYPAMNPEMWGNEATKVNVKTLRGRGIEVVEPDSGEVACGEIGKGRLPDVEEIYQHIITKLSNKQALKGLSAIVTAGPTYERIDPVRFIGNRSSGKQGYAIAEKLSEYGASVTLISGPTHLDCSSTIKRLDVETANEMLDAVNQSLPCDIAICAAAVGDWRINDEASEKLKKDSKGTLPQLSFTENSDILHSIANHPIKRPQFVAGFAAETNDVEKNAVSKIKKKGCDALLANHIAPKNNVFGADDNTVSYLSLKDDSRDIKIEEWPTQSKIDVADMLVSKIIQHLEKLSTINHTDEIITKLEAI